MNLNNLNIWSVPVLLTYWNDLMMKFEKNESDDILKVLYLVEEALNNRR